MLGLDARWVFICYKNQLTQFDKDPGKNMLEAMVVMPVIGENIENREGSQEIGLGLVGVIQARALPALRIT